MPLLKKGFKVGLFLDEQDSPHISSMVQRISFSDLVSNSEGVRVTELIDDYGLPCPYMSVRDIIMVVCGKSKKDACDAWTDLPEKYKNQLSEFLSKFQFKGRGEMLRPVITLQGAIKLIMWLPGDMAKGFRSQACDILTRYLTGDASLHAEVIYNARIGPIAASQAFLSDILESAKRKGENDTAVEYVYGTVSDAFPGLVKIGRTQDLDARLVGMNTSCAPKPHRYIAIAPTYHAVRDERIMHSFFMDVREEGEFFRTSIESVKLVLARLVTAGYNDEMQLHQSLHSTVQ